MGKDKKVKHEHKWIVMFDETETKELGYFIDGFETYIYAECDLCEKKLNRAEIEEILNKFYKG